MNDFTHPPIIKFADLKPGLHEGEGKWPCAYCWPVLRMTIMRDHTDAPSCGCHNFGAPLRMPWFVVRDINGELH